MNRAIALLPRGHARGFSLIEVLVTIVILLVGLLGLAGLQGRAFTAQLESYQRSQALILLKDMADRIDANRKNAAAYITAAPLGTLGACPAAGLTLAGTVAERDLCEWHNALLGSSEVGSAGAMIGARGCVFQEAAPALGTPSIYQVVVSWQGLNSTAAPNASTAFSSGSCGVGQYKDRSGVVNEALHRAIAVPVSVADLTPPPLP